MKDSAPLTISVFGLGYVGSVTSACLASRGHEVIGVDVQDTKVGQINAGQAPIGEPGLQGLIAAEVASGRLRAAPRADCVVIPIA